MIMLPTITSHLGVCRWRRTVMVDSNLTWVVQEDGGVVDGRRLAGNHVGGLVEHLTRVGMRLEIKRCGSRCGRVHLVAIMYHWGVVDVVKSLPLWIAAHAASSKDLIWNP